MAVGWKMHNREWRTHALIMTILLLTGTCFGSIVGETWHLLFSFNISHFDNNMVIKCTAIESLEKKKV